MAIAFGSFWSNNTTANPTNITIALAAHDYALCFGVSDNTNTSAESFTAGWTSRFAQNTTSDGMYFCGADIPDAVGTETLVSISQAGQIGGALSFTGVDNTTPRDVPVVTNKTTAGRTSPQTTQASITPVTNGAMLVMILAPDNDAAVDATFTCNTISGTTGTWTNRGELYGGAGYINGVVFTAPQTTAGAVTVEVVSTTTGAAADRAYALFALRPAGGGGGSTYNESIAETGSLSDTLSGILARLGETAESLTAVDTSSAIGSFSHSISETLSSLESISLLGSFVASVDEALTSLDSNSNALALSASISETSTAVDSTSENLTVSESVAETLSSLENVSSLVESTNSVDETLSAVDSNASNNSIQTTSADTLSAADTQSLTTVFEDANPETLSSVDSNLLALSAECVVTESTPAVDTSSNIAVLGAIIAETLTGLDGTNWDAGPIDVDVQESLTSLDTLSMGLSHAVSLDEILTTVDTHFSVVEFISSVVENLTLVDTISNQWVVLSTIDEVLSSVETTNSSILGQREDVQYPLANLRQAFPLAGLKQTYPLGD